RGRAVEARQLRDYLRGKLPEYMLPSAFVTLDAFPLTPSGKIDRLALPAPERNLETEEGYVAPRGALEEVLSTIFAEVLQLERVGVRDNFFDLGGHSLLATQIASRVREAFRVEVPLRKIFEEPTVEGLAQALLEGEGERNCSAFFCATASIVSRSVRTRKYSLQHPGSDSLEGGAQHHGAGTEPERNPAAARGPAHDVRRG